MWCRWNACTLGSCKVKLMCRIWSSSFYIHYNASWSTRTVKRITRDLIFLQCSTKLTALSTISSSNSLKKSKSIPCPKFVYAWLSYTHRSSQAANLNCKGWLNSCAISGSIWKMTPPTISTCTFWNSCGTLWLGHQSATISTSNLKREYPKTMQSRPLLGKLSRSTFNAFLWKSMSLLISFCLFWKCPTWARW